jgi:type VI secretion system lysozyme-like protein
MEHPSLPYHVIPSLLDRCFDDPSEEQQETAPYYHTRQQAIEAIRRDLQALLNTRQLSQPEQLSGEDIRLGIWNYGLPDLSALVCDQAQICRAIESAITHCEPRLTVRNVSSRQLPDKLTLEVQIEAELWLHCDSRPIQESSVDRVNFTATFSPNRQHLTMEGNHHGRKAIRTF